MVLLCQYGKRFASLYFVAPWIFFTACGRLKLRTTSMVMVIKKKECRIRNFNQEEWEVTITMPLKTVL